MTKLSIVLLLGLLLEPSWADFIDTEGSKDADFIDELLNQPESSVNFRQYSGYVTVDPDGNKRDFYYFVEAEGENPLAKPTLLFLGCHGGSSRGSPLLTAFIQVGPFKVESDGQTLDTNPFSWNKWLANPAPIIQTFYAEDKIFNDVKLDGVVTLVDAKHVGIHLDEIKHKGVVNEAVEQIAYSNRFIVNKSNLVGKSEVSSLIQRITVSNAAYVNSFSLVALPIFRC